MRSQSASDPLPTVPISRRGFLLCSSIGAAGVMAGAKVLGNRAWAGPSHSERDLIVHTKNPLNAEPPLGRLTDSYLTPTKRFYVRGHAPIPELDADTHTVRLEGLIEQPGAYTLAQLRDRFSAVECTATMTCAGNRRREHGWHKKPEGVQWDAGAIGTARWKGIRISELLKAAGVTEGAKHLWFESLDEISQESGEVISFGGSIPIEKAFADTDEVPGAIITWEMNGEPLTPAHGFPLRTVVPGYIGARSVKWLKQIVVSDRPSPNHYWAKAYRLYTEDTPLAVAESYPLYRFPVNVAVCESIAGNDPDSGTITVRGYALPNGRAAARIRRVRVSPNGGKRWVTAELIDEPKPFCWVRWQATIPVREGTKRLLAQAIDTTGAMTPDRVDWNMKGYMFNAWHAMPIGGH